MSLHTTTTKTPRRTRRPPRARQPPPAPHVPLDDPYRGLPQELAGLDAEGLPQGTAEDQLAAHGPQGDANISTTGGDAQGLPLEEEPPAEEALRAFDTAE